MKVQWYRRDWAHELPALVLRIPRNIRLAFLIGLGLNIACFFYDLAQFPLGDHDVGYLGNIPLLSGGRAGRWFVPVLHLFNGHVQIPLWTQMLAFSTQIAAGIGAVLLWKPDAKLLPLLAGAVLVSCMPTVMDFYYYHWMVLVFTAPQLFMVISLHLAVGAGRPEATRVGIRLVFSCLFALAAIASYQSAVMTWSVLYCGLWIAWLLRQEQAGQPGSMIKRLALPLVTFGAACILYIISLRLYPLVGLSLALYQFQTHGLADILASLPDVAAAAYRHFWIIQPFKGTGLTLVLLIMAVLGLLACLQTVRHVLRRSTIRAVLALLALAALPLAAKSQFFISAGNDYFSFRFAALGLSYVYLFLLLGLLASGRQLLRNCGLILFLLFIPAAFINALNAQVYHVRMQQHDLAVLNRVIDRIESLDEYDARKRYHLVQLGRSKPYVPNVYGDYYTSATGATLFSVTISQAWHPGYEFKVLSSYLQLDTRISEAAAEQPELLAKAIDFAQDKEPFPAKGSIGIVDGDTIVLFMDKNALETARAVLHSVQ